MSSESCRKSLMCAISNWLAYTCLHGPGRHMLPVQTSKYHKISLSKAGDIGDSEVVLNVLLGEGGSATGKARGSEAPRKDF